MAVTPVAIQGAGAFGDSETTIVTFDIGESTVEVPTGLTVIYRASATPIVGTAAYSTAYPLLAINEVVTATATGSSAGATGFGTSWTAALNATAASARSYTVTVWGQS